MGWQFHCFGSCCHRTQYFEVFAFFLVFGFVKVVWGLCLSSNLMIFCFVAVHQRFTAAFRWINLGLCSRCCNNHRPHQLATFTEPFAEQTVGIGGPCNNTNLKQQQKKNQKRLWWLCGERIESSSSIATDKVWLHSKVGKRQCDGAVVEKMMVNVFIMSKTDKRKTYNISNNVTKITNIKKIPTPRFCEWSWQLGSTHNWHPPPRSHLKPHLHQLKRVQRKGVSAKINKKQKKQQTKVHSRTPSASWQHGRWVLRNFPILLHWKQNHQWETRNKKTKYSVIQKEGTKILKKVDLEFVFVIKDMNNIKFNQNFSSKFCLKATSICSQFILLFSNNNSQSKNKNQICKICSGHFHHRSLFLMACFDFCCVCCSIAWWFDCSFSQSWTTTKKSTRIDFGPQTFVHDKVVLGLSKCSDHCCLIVNPIMPIRRVTRHLKSESASVTAIHILRLWHMRLQKRKKGNMLLMRN